MLARLSEHMLKTQGTAARRPFRYDTHMHSSERSRVSLAYSIVNGAYQTRRTFHRKVGACQVSQPEGMVFTSIWTIRTIPA